MSDAETLRRAAKLMRERATEPVAQPERWPQVVAPHVADWLDFEARTCERADANHPERAPQPADEHALAVARAYLSQETP